MWSAVVFRLLSAMIIVVPALSEGNGPSLSDLAPKLSEFKMNVHRLLEGLRIRKKRELKAPNESLDYKLRFGSVTPEDLPYLSDYNLTFWIPVQHRLGNQVLIGTSQGHLLLFEISDTNDKTAMTVAVSGVEDIAIKARAFSYDDEQWFSVLHYSPDGYYIQQYKRVGRGLERRQKIDLVGSSDMELVTLRGIHYLVVATYSGAVNKGLSYQASVVLYHWTQTQFDEIASRASYGARSVACWVLDGSLYIAVGQEVNDEGNFKVGSPIYFYNSKEENRLVLWEMLSTTGPMKVRHFYVAGSHYIIFIGRNDAVIYWWSSGQFLKWQTLSGTAFASDLSILSLGDGEVAIVIGLKEEALFYTLDASGYYILTFTMSFKGSSLQSLQFMYSGKAYYALALFAESHSQSMWRLTLASHYLPSISSLDPLQQCLTDTQELLKERQTELAAINDDLKRVWLKGSNQTITAKVVVAGTITSKRVINARDVIIMKYTQLPDTSMGLVIATLWKTMDSAEDVRRGMGGVVYKSTRQEIRGTKRFIDPLYVPSLTMESTDDDVNINGIRTSRLNNYALRKTGSQVFPTATLISNMHVETAHVATLNGISTDDLLLLHGRQVVTGNLIFSNVQASSLSTERINSIPFEDIVRTTSDSPIKDLKMISLLQSDVIDVHGETNGVDLGLVQHKIATVDGYNDFHGSLTFQHPLVIGGDMFVTGKVNKIIDIARLVSQSVTRDSQQDLTGLYRFTANQVINHDLLLVGSLNKISIDNLLTLSSNQKMYADLSFSALLTMTSDLSVDAVNGVDLSEEVLRKVAPYQFISGRKIFAKNVMADFVDMTDYVTLDGVDPSFLVQDIVHHKQGVVKSNSTVFKDVIVQGNVTALKGINGYEVVDLTSSVWLKSYEQTIYVPVKTRKFHFKNDLDALKVNNLNLETDVVHSYLDEAITSPKTFNHKTEVKRGFRMADGVKLNGIDPAAFKTEFERHMNDNKIHGTKTLDSLEIFGHLVVEKLNEVSISDIMQPQAPQTVQGPVEFAAELTSIAGNVISKSLSFGIFNNLDLQGYFRHAVTLNGLAEWVRNKHFVNIKASNLSVPTGSTLGGVSLNEMERRVVTLNNPQLITSPKLFEDSMHFSKMIAVFSVNGLPLSDYISNVVLTDAVFTISHKEFSGHVRSPNAFVRGAINGIKIEDLAKNVFYKSGDNEVTQPFTFKGHIDVEDLLASSALDGVEFKNLIFLQHDEVLGPAFLLSSVDVHRDIFIKGLLNGCDLSELASKSIYTNKSTQVIHEEIVVQTVEIVGNVKVENKVNELSVELLKNFITTSDDQVFTSDVVIEGNLVVDKLHLTEHETSAKISAIVKDAVRHSLDQSIKGRKVFQEHLDVTVLHGGDIFAHKFDGIFLDELYQTAVWKNEYREIEGDKIFNQFFTDIAIVNGYLNGLILPEDVVRTDVSEHISHPTYFMSDVYATTDLVVHGLIDGADFDAFVHHLVTLNGDQNVTAQLTFFDDVAVHDKLTIDGTINEIVLELVSKVKPVYPLQGYKVFIELHVSGPVSASSVNGFDLSQLDSSILRYNKDDYINEFQVFEKDIHAKNSLFVEWVNNVPLRHLTETFASLMKNVKAVLGYLQDFAFGLQKQLSRQLSATEDHVSRFAYFVLFQEINMGPTSKMLNGYRLENTASEFSHSMVLWTTKKHCVYMEKCCHLDFSYWLRVKKSGAVMVDGAPESGRYYPIHHPAPVMYDKDFFMWTNATDVQPKWCSEETQRMFLASYTHDGLLEVFIDVESAPLLSDVKSFRKGHLYSVAAFYYNTKHNEYSSTVVYAYNEFQRQWSEHQILPSFGVLSLDVVAYFHGHKEEVLLALGTGMETPSAYSTVYKWNSNEQAFEVLQNVPSRHVTSTLWIQKGRDLLLSMSSVDHWPSKRVSCSQQVAGGEINIYAYGEQLKWIQSIQLGGVVSMVSFSVDGDVYLAAASIEHQTIYIYEWQGYAAFVQIQSMFVGEVRHLSTYAINYDTYMTVALESGPSKILKMIGKGKHSTKSFDGRSLEQNDGITEETKIITGC